MSVMEIGPQIRLDTIFWGYRRRSVHIDFFSILSFCGIDNRYSISIRFWRVRMGQEYANERTRDQLSTLACSMLFPVFSMQWIRTSTCSALICWSSGKSACFLLGNDPKRYDEYSEVRPPKDYTSKHDKTMKSLLPVCFHGAADSHRCPNKRSTNSS